MKKQCRGCLKELFTVFFSPSASNQDGYRSYCKECDLKIGKGIKPYILREEANLEGRELKQFGRQAKTNRRRSEV